MNVLTMRRFLFFFRVIVILFLLLSPTKGLAQLYLGLGADFGNRLTIHPSADPYLKNPPSLSGSLYLTKNEELKNNWRIQYGLSTGILAYWLKVADQIDTTTSGKYSYFPEFKYSTFYLGARLLVGKQIQIGKKQIAFYLGGGITYYLSFPNESSYSRCNGTTCDDLLFEYQTDLVVNDFYKYEHLKAFLEFQVDHNISSRIVVGMRYQYHFKPAIAGTYKFYQVNNAQEGEISLTQRQLSLFVLLRIHR